MCASVTVRRGLEGFKKGNRRMGAQKIVSHPQAARMRSSYLHSGWLPVLGLYAGTMLVLFVSELPTWPALAVFLMAVLGTLLLGGHVWRRMWRRCPCPGCGLRLELGEHAVESDRRWGYHCPDCGVLYDSGVTESRDLG